MNRLFHTLRSIVDRSGDQPRADAEPSPGEEALPGFDNRIEVLSSYAERSAAYEDDLLAHLDQIIDQLAEQITVVIDDRQLDLELATYILSRRRSLGSGRHAQV